MSNYLEQTLVRASSDLAPAAQPDDRPFRHYSLRNRIISWVSRSLFDSITYTVRHGLLRGMKREGGLGWLPAALAARETQEDRFWRKQDLTGAVIYDVGAFHGLLTMLFARSGREVVSYEPNSRNRRRLEANVKLNRLRNVAIRPVGLGSRRALVTMLTPLGAPGGATIGRLAAEETRRPDRRADYEEVAVTTLDRDIRESGLPAPDLIKIDVEGVELEVLAGARDTLLRYRPQLFIEIHGETMNLKRSNAAAVVEYLRAMGYGQIRHVESGAPINASNAHVAARGHLYCNYGEAGRLTAAVSA